MGYKQFSKLFQKDTKSRIFQCAVCLPFKFETLRQKRSQDHFFGSWQILRKTCTNLKIKYVVLPLFGKAEPIKNSLGTSLASALERYIRQLYQLRTTWKKDIKPLSSTVLINIVWATWRTVLSCHFVQVKVVSSKQRFTQKIIIQ